MIPVFTSQPGLVPTVPLHILSTGRFSGLSALDAAAVASSAWGANNRAVYVPVNIPARFTIARFMLATGATVTGNVDVGIYNSNGARLLSTGSTARAGSNVVQYIGVTDQSFPAGSYYLAMVVSTTSGGYQNFACRDQYPACSSMPRKPDLSVASRICGVV